MSDSQDLVQQYRELYASGITQTSTDGTSTSFDGDRIRRALNDAAKDDLTAIANNQVRFMRMGATMRFYS